MKTLLLAFSEVYHDPLQPGVQYGAAAATNAQVRGRERTQEARGAIGRGARCTCISNGGSAFSAMVSLDRFELSECIIPR